MPRTALMVTVRAGNIYTLTLTAVTTVTVPTAVPAAAPRHSSSLYFALDGVPVDYYVPLDFHVSVRALAEVVGRTSAFDITPGSAPYVDAVVRVRSDRASSAQALTEQVMVPQRLRDGCVTAA